MQQEVKILLPDVNAFHVVDKALKSSHLETIAQENVFIDTTDDLLASNQVVCRIRTDSKTSQAGQTLVKPVEEASLCIKRWGEVTDGSSVRWSDEEAIRPEDAKSLTKSPSNVLSMPGSKVSASLRDRLGLSSGETGPEMKSLGGFHNVRSVYSWVNCQSQPGLTIRLDRTAYPFGERFEIEVPNVTVPTQDVMVELGTVLNQLGVTYHVGHETKFAMYLSGLKANQARSNLAVEVKLRFASENDYEILRQGLEPNVISSQEQTNFFFDGPDGELARRGTYFRVRLEGGTATSTLKENSDLLDGSLTCWKMEESVPAEVAQMMTSTNDPNVFFHHPTAAAEKIKTRYGVSSLRCVGKFTNHRTICTWNNCQSQTGLEMRLDKTTFPFGQIYELEVPNITVPSQDVVDELEKILKGLHVSFYQSNQTKLQTFLAGKI